jgi:hypothetical protein
MACGSSILYYTGLDLDLAPSGFRLLVLAFLELDPGTGFWNWILELDSGTGL